MGLFEPGTGSAAGSFVTADERAVLRLNKVAFPINKVVLQTTGTYGPQYLLETVLPGSDETRVISFSADSVPNRAAGLENIIALQDAGTYKPVMVMLVKDPEGGKATLIEEAS